MTTGSCHCGAVQFRVDTAILELTTCDCRSGGPCAMARSARCYTEAMSARRYFGPFFRTQTWVRLE
jgi:hypothetical protein